MRLCAAWRERSTYAHQIFHICDYEALSINSTASRLYGTNVMFAHGAALPKIIRLRRGHPGEQHIIAYFQI